MNRNLHARENEGSIDLLIAIDDPNLSDTTNVLKGSVREVAIQRLGNVTASIQSELLQT